MNSTLFNEGIVLTPSQFDRVFPFHLVIDQELRIAHIGPSLLGICPEIIPGDAVHERFLLLKPEAEMTFLSLAGLEGSVTLWRGKNSGLKFKGHLLTIKEPKRILLLWSPWLEDSAELEKFGLQNSDFAIHDPIIHMLQIFRDQKIALQDERDLVDKLSQERADLIRENHELSRQFGLLYDELVTMGQEEAKIFKLSLIARQAESAVVMTDAQGRVEWINDGFTHITGYTQQEMLGKTPGSVLQGEKSDPQVIEYIRKQFRMGESFGADLINYKKSGQEFWIQFEAQPIRDEDNRITNWMAIERDITEQKVAELALLEAKKAAEDANRAKSEFLANMSHEIRTPMNGVLGMLDLLRRTPLTPEQQEFTETAAQSAETLLSIINGILDFSKIEAGKLELDNVDFNVRELVEQVCALLATPAYTKGLEFNCFIEPQLPSQLQGDPTRLRQIITNLIGNAIKFTGEGEVSVEVLCVSQDEAQAELRFTVKDTGIGIRPEDRERLFDPFEQADGATTRRFGGTGLGLAISKSLVNRMGGEIHVESEPGVGSSFWFTATFKKQPPNDIPELPRSLYRRRILVVDDNATSRSILNYFLKDWGAEVTLMGQAAQALEQLRQAHRLGTPFELVILDLQMPDMDGLMLGRAMAKEDAIKDTPRILLSSGGTISEAERIEAGIYQTLTKPVRQWQLFEAVVSTLDNRLFRPRRIEARPVEKAPRFSGRRVLLVEDNPVNQKVALKMLEQHQVIAVLAENGYEALRELEQNHYDLVLMDCHMPKMDGYEATRLLRDLEKVKGLPRTPVVALTANTLGEAREKCLQCGMDDFLAKPFLLGDLTRMLTHWLLSPETEDHSTETDISSWDCASALQRLGGDEELLGEMKALFISEAPKQLERLRLWEGQKPATVIVEAAHSLKGMAMHFCAQGVVSLAALLEQKARKDEIDQTDPLRLQLIEAVERLIETLRKDLSEPKVKQAI